MTQDRTRAIVDESGVVRVTQLACSRKDVMKAHPDVAAQPLSGSPRMTARVSEKVAVSVVFVAAMFMSIMDTTIVNVALPTIGRDFSVSPTAVDSISIAFLVSLAVFIPASGWLGDRFGGKRVLLTAIAVFSVASALCGVASSLGELVLFRILQGAGGGMLAPVGMAMLFRVFHPRGTHPGVLDPHRADHPGAGSRPGTRGPAGHRPVVALGVLRQRAHRGGGARLRRHFPPPAHRDPARALRPGRVPALGHRPGAAHVRRLGGTGPGLGIGRGARDRRS